MKHTLIIISVLLLSLALRLHNAAVYPQRGATSDEYAFAFQGISLLTKGVPIAWSAIPLYKEVKHLAVDGLYFPIVQPYLDHPPLFGLLVGAWAMAAGESAFEHITLVTIRMIPVALSFVSAVFVYLLARNIYGEQVGRWSLAVYATATLFIVNSRVAVAESLLTPLWLAGLWLVSRNPRKTTRSLLFVVGILSAAAILTKILGLVVWLSAAAILLYRRTSLGRIAIVTAGAAVGIFVLYLYARSYDETLFWAIQSYQGMSRVLGPRTIWTILGSPGIVNTVYYDGWYFWGLFALGLAAFDGRKNVMVVIPAFLYLLLLIVSVNQTDIHGWYLLPLFPFLAIAGGKLLVDSIENARWTLLIWAVMVGANLIQTLYAVPFGMTPSLYRWLVGSVVVAALTAIRFKRMGYGMALLFILGTAITTVQYVHPV